jgi:hypothetical protein
MRWWTMGLSAGLVAAVFAVPGQTMADSDLRRVSGPDAQTRAVAAYWTPERQRAAVARDIVVDERGRSYLRSAGGRLEPYGTGTPVTRPTLEPVGGQPAPSARPVPLATADTTGPSITNRSPSDGATISSTSVTFQATVTDPSGVKSVTVKITYPDGRTGSFSAAAGSSGVWSVTLQNFTAGSWKWQVIAKDTVRGGNTTASPWWGFTVAPDGGGTPSGDVANAQWTKTSPVLSASGRILFEMPANPTQSKWNAYVCSGTVVSDGSTTARSMILTAAHCVYDDEHKAYARNVLFIPDQQWSGTGTDRTCGNDKYGCWAPNAGIVDADWTSRTWPNNIPWDYGYYVVANSGRHYTGKMTASDSLETAVPPLTPAFVTPTASRASAFGYSYNQDPKLMYCAQARGYTGGSSPSLSDNWWQSQCGLSGGASGGPWLDEATVSGSGQIVSVNSWGYSNSPGMAGPKLDTSSSTTRTRAPICVYNVAKNLSGTLSNTTASTCPS